jgi:hypothetical protein
MQLLKRFAVTLLGVGLLVLGAAMMVLPGPGIVVIVGGLAVLATEYVWARTLLDRAKSKAQDVQAAAVASPLRTAGSVLFALALLAVGILMIVIDDVAWPVLEPTLDKLWAPFTGGVLVVTGLILMTTTYLTIRAANGEATTYTPDDQDGSRGATRYSPG